MTAHKVDSEANHEGSQVSLYKAETRRILSLTLPLVAHVVCTESLAFMMFGFVGHLGTFHLSAALLGNSLFTVTGLSVLMGLASGMETFCGQAYGAKEYTKVGVVLQRAMLICCIAFFGIILLWTQIEHGLVLVGQDRDISRAAARYLMMSVPALFFAGIVECLNRFLVAQAIVAPAMIISILVTVVALVYNWLFIFYFRLGLAGAALAQNLAQFSMAVLLWGWIMWDSRRNKHSTTLCWCGWSFESLKGWGPYLKLAIPGTVMMCLQWWAGEALILLSGLLKPAELSLSVMGICMTIFSSIIFVPQGMAEAVSTRIANELGAGNAEGARRIMVLSSGLVLILMTFLAALLLLFRSGWVHLFTRDHRVEQKAGAIFPLLAIALFGEGLNTTLSGVVMGCGWQVVGAIVNGVTYWIVGLPTLAVMVFKMKAGVVGFWWTICMICSTQGIVMSLVTMRINWKVEAKRARERVEEVGGAVEMTDHGPPSMARIHAERDDSELGRLLPEEGKSSSQLSPSDDRVRDERVRNRSPLSPRQPAL